MPEPVVRLPEREKREGVHYALTDDGVELPIVDVSHPAFAVALDPAEQHERVEKYLREELPFAKAPAFVRRFLLRALLRGSFLARGLSAAEGTYLTGMSTYALKLGPDNLGRAYTKPIDREIAKSFPVFAVRLRLADMAHLTADAVSSALRRGSPERPLHFFNIASGPAIDTLNALVLLSRDAPELLARRHVVVHALDVDHAGPRFGARALAALQAEGGPLRGLHVDFRHVPYDWAHPEHLATVLEPARSVGALVLASSEGGLFEYGGDEEIVGNLVALRRASATDLIVIGSVTRDDEATRRLRATSRASTRPRGIDVFAALCARAGFHLERVVERPFSDHVALGVEIDATIRERG